MFAMESKDPPPYEIIEGGVKYTANTFNSPRQAAMNVIPVFLQNEKKWKQLAELAIKNCEFQLAQECLHRAEDFGGLLLLASSAGHAEMIAKLAESALEKGKNNVAFLAFYLLGRYLLIRSTQHYSITL